MIRFVTLLPIALLVACGTSRESQTRTVETLTTTTGPIVADTPVGQIVVQPVQHRLERRQVEDTTAQTRIEPPPLGSVIGPALSSTPWGAIIGGLTTVAAGAFALRKRHQAKVAERHRDQLIDSVEAARDRLPDEIDAQFCAALSQKQDNDLQAYIQRRTH